MSFYNNVLKYLKECKVALADKFAPYFTIGVCNHIVNLENQKREFYTEHGRVANLRTHVFMCAPPGFTKCVQANTQIQMADGRLKRADEVVQGDVILTLDKEYKIKAAPVSACYKLSAEKLLRITTKTGRSIEVTPEHPFLLVDEWVRADKLVVKDRIAVPDKLPCKGEWKWTKSRVRLLAYLIAEGHLKSTPTFTNTDEVLVNEVREYVKEFKVKLVPCSDGISYYLSAGQKGVLNPLVKWLQELDLYGLTSHGKFIPEEVFELPDELIKEFLQVYTSCDGTFADRFIGISSMSHDILNGLQTLLLRVGIWSVKDYKANQVRMTGSMKEKFVEEIGFVGKKSEKKLIKLDRNSIIETIPKDIWWMIENEPEFTTWQDMSVKTKYHGVRRGIGKKPAPSRGVLRRFADVLDSAKLMNIADGDILWDEITSIEAIDGGNVIDLTIEGTHNFIANNIIVHNTLYLEKFLKGKTSIVGGNAFVQCGFEGSMTEAGFTGTVKVVNGEPVEVKGAAYENRMSIMGIDEFASLTNAMRQEHSINLDNAMLTALDSGFLIKRLALGKIQYITQLTLFTGSQPMRFNLTSGLGRRFIYIWFIPTRDEEQLIRESRRSAKSHITDLSIVNDLKADLKKIVISCESIEKVKFDNTIYKLFDKIHVPHFEETLYERMAIGYTLAKNNGSDKILEVTMDSTLREMFIQANDWRLEIKKGAETSQVYQVVKEMSGSTISQVKRRLTDLGLSYSQSTNILNILEKQGRVRYVRERVMKKGGRPRTLVIASEN